MDEVLAAIDRRLDTPQVALHSVTQWIDIQAGPTLYGLALESSRIELGQAVAHLGVAREAIDRALQAIDAAHSILADYRARLTSPVVGQVETTSGPFGVAAGSPDDKPGARSQEELVEAARARLKPPVPGARTYGAWIDCDGEVHDLVSGNRDQWFVAAADYGRERGWVKGRAVLGLARHIEVKFAMRLRDRHDRRRPGDPPLSETIVIDRPPCGTAAPAEWTCDATLADWLPPGATLIVIDRDGNRHIYRGTADP
ncbi:DddA-like double-stranded DNA deaminase toxin [Actinokineospora sp. 24-640]